MDATDAPSDLNTTPAIVKLISLMEEQISVLHRIDQRQAAADISTQPIPQVPATSSSTWGALLRSRIAETIQPKVDRWRSGLDALLVFLGLFSAIVTSFLIDSLSGLQQDEAARTNELLANLTEILIQLNSGANVSTLKIALPTSFQPEAVDVRLNSYWSISLILSLSIAALAVACRGFLNVAVLSSHASAADKLIDINTRWKAAEKILGPALEVIPQFLFLPVVLFVVGLLDSIFSSILSLEILPTPIAAASGLSLFFVAGVVAFLAFALVDASVRPDTSPFQSNLAHVFSKTLKFAHLHGKYKKEGPSRRTRIESTYHEIVQATHDDETLDKASAALLGILEPSFTWHHSLHHLNETLDHLLSPEASLRCNHTAAQVIVDLPRIFNRGNRHLLPSLVEAAQRSANYRSMATLWTSTYVKACAVLVGAFQDEHPAVVCIVGSSYVFTVQDLHQQLSMDYLLVDIFFDYLHSVSPDGSLTPGMVGLFKPNFIEPRHVLAFLHRVSIEDARALVIISLLMAAKTPASVMAAARHSIEVNSLDSDILPIHLGGLVVKSFLQSSSEADLGDANQVLALVDLCSTCIVAAKRKLLQNPGSRYWSRFLETVEAAPACLPPSPELATLTKLMADCRKLVEPVSGT